ncbi:MAG: hypothetical protein AAGA53_07990 [Pseudomonadota bacterium]
MRIKSKFFNMCAGFFILSAGLVTATIPASAAKEIGHKCAVISETIPFIQRRKGENFNSSAIFTKRLDLEKGDKVLVLGSIRSVSTSGSPKGNKMLFGALLAAFQSRPERFENYKENSRVYQVPPTDTVEEGWQQISPALAYNVTGDSDKYGLINLHSLYTADWTGEHWITVLAYAATTHAIADEEISVSSHQRACDLVAVKLD